MVIRCSSVSTVDPDRLVGDLVGLLHVAIGDNGLARGLLRRFSATAGLGAGRLGRRRATSVAGLAKSALQFVERGSRDAADAPGSDRSGNPGHRGLSQWSGQHERRGFRGCRGCRHPLHAALNHLVQLDDQVLVGAFRLGSVAFEACEDLLMRVDRDRISVTASP